MSEVDVESASVATLLLRTADALSDMNERALDLQLAITEIAARQVGAEAMESLQTLDLMTQELANLAAFIRTLSVTSEKGWELDPSAAIGGITLASLAGRLSSDQRVSDTAPDDDIQWFDTKLQAG